MKKCLLFFLILFSLNGFSQQWPQPNAVWTYCYGAAEWWATFGSFQFYYTQDTTINGQIYNVSEPEFNYPNEMHRYYTRYSNDTVYRWINNSEYLFFHFQLHMDEVITTYRAIGGTSDTACSSILPLKVIDSATVVINGQNITKWILEDTLGFDDGTSGAPYLTQYILYETFGFGSYPWFYNNFEDQNCSMIFDAGYAYLGGYDDDFAAEWVSHCPTTGIDKTENKLLTIYPNPTSHKLYLNGEAENYFIYSSDGKLIQTGNIEDGFIDVEILDAGIYLLEIKDKNNVFSILRFV